MKNYFFITGTSRGIGKEIALILLKDSTNVVFGYARTCSIDHPGYSHTMVDLADTKAIKKISFPEITAGVKTKMIHINNSAVLGPIGRLGKQTDHNIISNLTVNLIAPLILTDKFIRVYRDAPSKNKMIINISSGAGRIPIDAWSMYCCSKAGLDMMSMVIAEEQKHGFKYPFRTYSVAPGIIETAMQEEIRKVKPEEFSRVHEFIQWKEKNELKTAKKAAKEVVELIDSGNKDVLIQL